MHLLNMRIILADKTDNAKFLISRGAMMISHDNENKSIIKSMTHHTPRALEAFQSMLDEGITLAEKGSVINLDFSKLFVRNTTDSNIDEMHLFQDIAASPFKATIQHPLCQAFLYDKFQHVKIFFMIFNLFPFFIFAGAKDTRQEYETSNLNNICQWCTACMRGCCSASSAPPAATRRGTRAGCLTTRSSAARTSTSRPCGPRPRPPTSPGPCSSRSWPSPRSRRSSSSSP